MKRIIICCDGTWQDAEETRMKSPTNVVLLARAIRQVTKDKTPETQQVVYYQGGVGTSLGTLARITTGAFGAGLMENVREAYGFIVHNWEPGDEIYLFGFSRGAYTARSVGGLISKFGMLTKRGMDGIGFILDAYRNMDLDDPTIFNELTFKYERIATDVPIHFIGVWDTVGSLGIPEAYIGGWKIPVLDNILNRVNKQYQFSDTNLHPNVKYAYQALAINEHRAPFQPTLWKVTDDNKSTKLKQVWFAGAHSSVGGGDDSHGVSDISLAWMIQQISDNTDLEYDIDYLLASRETFGPNHMEIPWGTEDWEDSFTSFWRLSGYITRTPGKYPLAKGERTNEFLHKSVNTRIKVVGKKYDHPDLSTLEEDVFGAIEEKLRWP